MENVKTVVFAAKDGVLFVKLKELPVSKDFILISFVPIKDPNAYCVEVTGEATCLHFPELSVDVLQQHLGTFICGIFGEPYAFERDGIVYSSEVTCPACERPLFPYDEAFVCDDCNVVVVFKEGVGARKKWPEEMCTKNRFILVTDDSVLSNKLSDMPYEFRSLPKVVTEIKERLGVS